MRDIIPSLSNIICVFGMRGFGKTYHTKELIKNCKRLLVYDTLNEYYKNVKFTIYSFDLLKVHLNKPNFSLSFSPRNLTTAFDPTCQLVGAIGDITFIIEEVDFYSSTFFTPEPLQFLVRYGRHRNVSLIVTARRPAEVPRLITSQSTAIHCFKIIEPRDILYLSEFFGEQAKTLKSLTRGQFLEYREGEVITHYET